MSDEESEKMGWEGLNGLKGCTSSLNFSVLGRVPLLVNKYQMVFHV